MRRKYKADDLANVHFLPARRCRCGIRFIPYRRGQINCSICIQDNSKSTIELLNMARKAEIKAKRLADCSHATIYTSALCDQNFLKSLVPRKELSWCW